MSPFRLFKKHPSVPTFFKNLYHVDSSSGYGVVLHTKQS